MDGSSQDANSDLQDAYAALLTPSVLQQQVLLCTDGRQSVQPTLLLMYSAFSPFQGCC